MTKYIISFAIGIAVIVASLYLLPNKTEYQKDEVVTSTEPDSLIIPPLRERVGQLLAIGHWTNTTANYTEDLVSTLQLGSVIVMQAPENAEEIANWTTNWQAAASGTPLLISIDQEGGVVSRLKSDEYTQIAQPDISDTTTAYGVANKRAEELTTLGINANYAPVLDKSELSTSFMYKRVFRETDMIGVLADAMVRGYQSNNVIAVAKHYPGHPDTITDSHLALPTLDMTLEEYYDHTSQFTELVTAGNVKMLMTAHVLVSALDTERPATLSPAVLQDLRERIGYTGIIITDDLAMQAVSDTWTQEEAAVLALQAGADMVMLASKPEDTEKVIEAIVVAVEAGTLPESRINEAYRRVVLLKESL